MPLFLPVLQAYAHTVHVTMRINGSSRMGLRESHILRVAMQASLTPIALPITRKTMKGICDDAGKKPTKRIVKRRVVNAREDDMDSLKYWITYAG